MKKLLIPFFSAGFPELNSTTEIILELYKLEPDYIEIGLPHSDALADGPIIQEASAKALENGLNIEILFEQIHSIKNQIENAKLILFTYYNPLLAYGLHKALKGWKQAGGMGVLIPDLPIEETQEIVEICQKENIKLIFLIAPTSTPERIRRIVEASKEFLYLVSVTGVTGERNSVNEGLKPIIEYIKSLNPNLKIVIGFGINNAQTAQQAIMQGADGIVIGTAFLKVLKQNGLKAACDLLADIKNALKA